MSDKILIALRRAIKTANRDFTILVGNFLSIKQNDRGNWIIVVDDVFIKGHAHFDCSFNPAMSVYEQIDYAEKIMRTWDVEWADDFSLQNR